MFYILKLERLMKLAKLWLLTSQVPSKRLAEQVVELDVEQNFDDIHRTEGIHGSDQNLKVHTFALPVKV